MHFLPIEKRLGYNRLAVRALARLDGKR